MSELKSKYIIFAKDVLTKSKNKPLTVKEIWRLGDGDKYFKKLIKSGKDPFKTLSGMLSNDQKKRNQFLFKYLIPLHLNTN